MATVLIVEDDATLAGSLETQLSQTGLEAEAVTSTFAALDRLDAHKYEAIVADIAMPAGMPNGLSLARMVRVRNPQCRVVLMTGYADLAKDGDLFGARVFAKPVDVDALAAHIKQAIATGNEGARANQRLG